MSTKEYRYGIINANSKYYWHKKYLKFTKTNHLLYHYTDVNAFKSIVENKSLWMSSPKYLNDSKEFIDGKNKVFEFIDFYLARDKNISKDSINILQKVQEKLRQSETFNDDIFICSFSTRGDDLSQWRSYGQNGSGICIEFKNLGQEQLLDCILNVYRDTKMYF
ncbi:hypothetical protein IB655_03725, partial [Francisella noatunensis]